MNGFTSARQILVVLLLCLTAAASLVYSPITKYPIYDPATGGRTADVAQYVRMYEGAPLDTVPKPYRYRILTPYLAGLVPFLPPSITQLYDITPEKIIAFKFGMINLLGLAATGFVLFVFCRSLAFSPRESILASYLFFASFFVLNYGGVPLVDALGYFFLILGIASVLNHWYLALFLSFTIGMFAKETTLLVVLSIFLLKGTARSKLIKALLCLPGLVAYLIFRLAMFPTEWGTSYSASRALEGILSPSKPWTWILIDGGLAFGVLWLLSIHGWLLVRKTPDNPLYRLSFIVPLMMLTPLLIHSDVGRVWTLAFPAVIPLSIVSLRRLFESDSDDEAGQASAL